MKYKLSLKHIWLAVGIVSLILPVFLPSEAGANNAFLNVIGVVNILKNGKLVERFATEETKSLESLAARAFAPVPLAPSPSGRGLG